MVKQFLKFFISLLMVLHFTGINQMVASYAKDKSSFMTMLSMTEEETKKEKDNKEDDSEMKDLKAKYPLLAANHIYTLTSFGYVLTSENAAHQFIADSQSPPPDFTA